MGESKAECGRETRTVIGTIIYVGLDLKINAKGVGVEN